MRRSWIGLIGQRQMWWFRSSEEKWQITVKSAWNLGGIFFCSQRALSKIASQPDKFRICYASIAFFNVVSGVIWTYWSPKIAFFKSAYNYIFNLLALWRFFMFICLVGIFFSPQLHLQKNKRKKSPTLIFLDSQFQFRDVFLDLKTGKIAKKETFPILFFNRWFFFQWAKFFLKFCAVDFWFFLEDSFSDLAWLEFPWCTVSL